MATTYNCDRLTLYGMVRCNGMGRDWPLWLVLAILGLIMIGLQFAKLWQ